MEDGIREWEIGFLSFDEMFCCGLGQVGRGGLRTVHGYNREALT